MAPILTCSNPRVYFSKRLVKKHAVALKGATSSVTESAETAASSFHGNKRIAHLKGKCNLSVKYVNDVLYGRTFSKSKL